MICRYPIFYVILFLAGTQFELDGLVADRATLDFYVRLPVGGTEHGPFLVAGYAITP